MMADENLRYYDEQSKLWYVVYWDEILKCFVTVLESGQQSVVA